ncbi:thioredoxin-like [Anneissia japonica]|uniref:thioredoxin-like n=1 Tax=Anneissia japonica TaxID=1529436 RepID=UPI0014255AB4|nr:thioredoxin-like [Anneissia japonica]
MIKDIPTKADFTKELSDAGDKLVVVDFYAQWCGPCRMISPKIEEMSKVYTDVIFLKVDVDENSDTAESESISAMPTFKLYKNSKLVDELTGASEVKIKELIEKHK